MFLSTVLYLVRAKNSKQVRDTFLQKKKDRPAHTRTAYAVWPWNLGRDSYHQKSTDIGVPGRGAFHFQHGYSLLLVSVPFSLIIKADIQCMFVRPQTGYFS